MMAANALAFSETAFESLGFVVVAATLTAVQVPPSVEQGHLDPAPTSLCLLSKLPGCYA